eukprot:TRINITY_DN4205_c0_g1_i1.p1 TRINITY_DN4205_c0_g1~~TRINITY_DN4205_c0_g1_i1.p1  ORF type:complete len:106 (+),score=17.08 TRINITY_DN4205_c0_g1_i1:357-674(+)
MPLRGNVYKAIRCDKHAMYVVKTPTLSLSLPLSILHSTHPKHTFMSRPLSLSLSTRYLQKDKAGMVIVYGKKHTVVGNYLDSMPPSLAVQAVESMAADMAKEPGT